MLRDWAGEVIRGLEREEPPSGMAALERELDEWHWSVPVVVT